MEEEETEANATSDAISLSNKSFNVGAVADEGNETNDNWAVCVCG